MYGCSGRRDKVQLRDRGPQAEDVRNFSSARMSSLIRGPLNPGGQTPRWRLYLESLFSVVCVHVPPVESIVELLELEQILVCRAKRAHPVVLADVTEKHHSGPFFACLDVLAEEFGLRREKTAKLVLGADDLILLLTHH
jgi:hypothetical protein